VEQVHGHDRQAEAVAVRIFVYGTLLEPSIFRLVTGRAQPAPRAATLPRHRRVRLARLPYPTLLPDRAGQVTGAVLRVGPTVLARLRRYEGPLYRFVAVKVRRGRAWTNVHAWIARRGLAAPRIAYRSA